MLVRMLVLAVVSAGLLVPTVAASAPAAPAAPTSTVEAAPRKVFTPAGGVTFNNPMPGSKAQRAILSKLMRSIRATPRGANIDIFSWNFLTSEGSRALLAAQRRGVRARLLMAKTNITQIDNPPFRRLRAGLAKGNKGRRADRKSFARVCQGTCRSQGGGAHSKIYLFSRVGKAKHVYIQGSANFTNASAWNQWNDIYTHVNNKRVYDWALTMFNQAARDKPVSKPYAHEKFGDAELIMFPATGRKTADPVMKLLNKVKCRGATNTASKRTVIRIAPDVVRNDRGMRLGKKVRSLWESGCDVRLGYTVMGIDVGRMLRAGGGRGPVPMRHLAIDSDEDGQFDKYFHLKAMSIVGNVAGKRNNNVVLNGSANWSGLSKVSDENLGIYWRKNVTRRYQDHINYWYLNFATATGSGRTVAGARTVGAAEPRLVFGSGRNTIYEDGEPVSTDGTNPFALMEVD